MKNLQQSLHKNALLFCLVVFAATLFSACSKKEAGSVTDTSTSNAPVIQNVTNLTNRTTALGFSIYGDWIIIRGVNLATTYKVEFSNIAASDSLMYATDSTITVKIPASLPNASDNPIKVTTTKGAVTYNYQILQPPPVITSFTPIVAAPGTDITITGEFLLGATNVKFNTTDAKIVSNTRTQLVVTVPVGVSSGYIFITTPSGSVKSSVSFGLAYVLYDDALATGWADLSYSSVAVYNNTTNVLRGTNSIKNNYSVGFGGFRFKTTTAVVNLTGYTALKFSIFGGTNSSGYKIRVIVNAGATTYTLTLPAAGTWTQYEVPFTSLGSPTTLSTIEFKEYSGKVFEVYFDDIGLYKP